MDNLFANVPASLPSELVQVLAANQHVRVERIVSTGQGSPPGFWYDQDELEWVVVLQGEAQLILEGSEEPVVLQSGDYLTIPPHQKHRVASTTPTPPTIWLAVFARAEDG